MESGRNLLTPRQCSMPAFEGIFKNKKADNIVQDVLFEQATFYSYARLTMHTDGTLSVFTLCVKTLGKAMRVFLLTACPMFATRELPGETQSRQRRKKASETSATAKPKAFNLNTYKYHRLGDYPSIIRELGPMDNYSTQTVCSMLYIMFCELT